MDNIKQWLVERKIIYSILALFYRGDIYEGLETIQEYGLLENFTNYTSSIQLSNWPSKVIEEINKDKNTFEYRDLILDDYQRLFVGPDEILAPLWESAYKEKDKLLFGERELAVRKFYNSVGLNVKESEPADYLPLHLSFVSRLCVIAVEENLKDISENLVKQHDFLKEHLLSWIPVWIEDVNKNGEDGFWVGFSQMTKAYLENDLNEIEKIINAYHN
jgi:TorA maturation chaperone TorD